MRAGIQKRNFENVKVLFLFVVMKIKVLSYYPYTEIIIVHILYKLEWIFVQQQHYNMDYRNVLFFLAFR